MTHHDVGEVMIRPELAGAAELMLVSASLGLKQVALLDQGLPDTGTPPAFVVVPAGRLRRAWRPARARASTT